jgi:hypothetical protein
MAGLGGWATGRMKHDRMLGWAVCRRGAGTGSSGVRGAACFTRERDAGPGSAGGRGVAG